MLEKKTYEQPFLALVMIAFDVVTASGGVRFNSTKWGEEWEDWNVKEDW